MTKTRILRHVAAALLTVATLGASAAAASATTATGAAHPTTVKPDDSGVWTVENGPVAYYNSPSTRVTVSGGQFSNGEQVDLMCYEFGGPAGPYGNTLWYETFTSDAAFVFINDHYLSTPGTAANPDPQGTPCRTAGSGDVSPGGPYYTAVGSAVWSNEPNASSQYKAGFGFNNGDTMSLYCYAYGGPAGPYNNVLWYYAEDTNTQTYGWVNDHYLSTPDTAANPVPESWSCVQADDYGF